MSSLMDMIFSRQFDIARGECEPLPLPRFANYAICNLRGGIGKTSIAFNLTYLTEDVLAVDTCPQCNLTYFFDKDYLQHVQLSVYDMLLPAFMPGLGNATHIARNIAATNSFFQGKKAFYIPSDARLYVLPSQFSNAIAQAQTIPGATQTHVLDRMFYSLRDNIRREMEETGTKRSIIDTSPFFSGTTHLALYASDALLIPVRTDQQSINSLQLLLNTLSNPASEFRRIMPSQATTPKVQMVMLTHCGWSTVSGSRNKPNQQTKIYIEQVMDIIRQNITYFTTSDPANHLVLLDDFFGSGRISSAKSKPIPLLVKGERLTINRVRTEVNESVAKIQNQIKYIHDSIF